MEIVVSHFNNVEFKPLLKTPNTKLLSNNFENTRTIYLFPTPGHSAVGHLNDLQNTMFRIFFNSPRTTPKMALWWDLGAFPMEYRIKEMKLNLLYYILNLEDTELSKEILEEQIKFKFPGLASETKEYITKLKLPDIIENRTLNLNKYKW